MPLLVVSRYAKSNYVDHSTTDQTSILRFIEDNWRLGRLGNFSFDAKAGSLANMFAFGPGRSGGRGPHKLFLDPQTGERGHDGEQGQEARGKSAASRGRRSASRRG